MIAHTIMSWSFSDGQHLAVSIETRKEKGEEYSAVAGFFRQYELIYIAADEADVVKLRTNFRDEDVYLYRLQPCRRSARGPCCVDYLEAMNALAREPGWYNALTTNCTTTIRQRVMHAGGNLPLSWKLLANGYLPELLYERGALDTSLPFAELKRASHIDERARAAGDGDGLLRGDPRRPADAGDGVQPVKSFSSGGERPRVPSAGRARCCGRRPGSSGPAAAAGRARGPRARPGRWGP